MKTQLSLLCLLFTFLHSLAQDTLFYNAFNEKVKKKSKAYYYRIVKLNEDSTNAIIKENYKSGTIKSITSIRIYKGHKFITTTNYTEDQNTFSTSSKIDGKLQGQEVYYYDKNRVQMVFEYKDNELIDVTLYDEQGNLRYQESKSLTDTLTSNPKSEKMPEYPGGINELSRNIAQEIRYPKESSEHGNEGKVLVSFYVDELGNACYFRVVKGVDIYIDKEALRVIKQMKRWKPGTIDGNPYWTKFTVPINFALK